MNNIVKFDNKNIRLINHNGQKYITAKSVADALGYANSKKVSNLYQAHKEEFEEGVSLVLDLGTRGNPADRSRIFNREGAWLIGMFARTPKAVEFRKWVLKVLGTVADSSNRPVVVQEHTRSLPTGKKEIVLSEKAKTEIGGIVKSCLGTSQYRLKEDEVANRVVALMTSYNFLTQYDTLMREARELKYQAEQREQQARSFMEAANKIEKAVA